MRYNTIQYNTIQYKAFIYTHKSLGASPRGVVCGTGAERVTAVRVFQSSHVIHSRYAVLIFIFTCEDWLQPMTDCLKASCCEFLLFLFQQYLFFTFEAYLGNFCN